MTEFLGCPDCKSESPELYMVWPRVWADAGLEHDDGWVCLDCLEKRLGRDLVLEDFTGAAANYFFTTVPDHIGCDAQGAEFNDYFTALIESETHA